MEIKWVLIMILGILGLWILFLVLDQYFYRRAIRRYRALPEEEKGKVGLYAPFTLSIFTSLGYRPSRDELGITFRESIHMGRGYVIPHYSFVQEFT